MQWPVAGHSLLEPEQAHWPPSQLPPAPQSELAQHAAVVCVHAPLQRLSPVGQPQVPASQMPPSPHSPFAQQLVLGMQRVLQGFWDAGHAHAPITHVCPEPFGQSAFEQHPPAGTQEVPQSF